MVITRTLGGGEIAFLPGHAPFLAALTENHTRIATDGGITVDVAVHGGFVEVSNNKVSILSDVAELGDTIDVARAVAARERAEELIRRGEDGEAEAALRRAEARLAASGSN
jgi:F-type H+-transporting ATPase subunit epsilon